MSFPPSVEVGKKWIPWLMTFWHFDKLQPEMASARKYCNACYQQITGQFVQALENEWHVDCFRCSHCQTKLAGKFEEIVSRNSEFIILATKHFVHRRKAYCARVRIGAMISFRNWLMLTSFDQEIKVKRKSTHESGMTIHLFSVYWIDLPDMWQSHWRHFCYFEKFEVIWKKCDNSEL